MGNHDYKTQQIVVSMANAANKSAGFPVPAFTSFMGILVPDVTNGNLSLEVSINGGANYYPVLDPADGATAIICANGSDAGWIDVSDWVRFLPSHKNCLVRIANSANQAGGAVSFNILCRG